MNEVGGTARAMQCVVPVIPRRVIRQGRTTCGSGSQPVMCSSDRAKQRGSYDALAPCVGRSSRSHTSAVAS